MSDSFHQTLKSVYGGKSDKQINEMIENEEPDLMAYAEKGLTKKAVQEKRKKEKVLLKVKQSKINNEEI